ncbi:MAG: hypothetical protein II698_05085 [Ruminococcus sp.]|nr:hypothetical protein [Ruminococcus sp.]MBQ4238664.1 hypothetical protein [Ruminococcus sp.]
MDNNLREALQQIVNLSEDDKIRLAFDSMKGLAPEITKIVESGNIAVAILSIFATSVAADGKLTGEEYSLVHAFLKLFKIEMDDEKMVAMIKDLSSDEAYRAVLSLSKVLSEQGQAYLVSLVAVICAIDDRIDSSEITFISDLYNT